MEISTNKKYKPLILTATLIVLDQFTKLLVVLNIPRYDIVGHPALSSYWNLFDGAIRLIHVRNKNIAFSLGKNLPESVKFILFVVAATTFLIILTIYLIRSKELINQHRWLLAGILGGGYGNIIDRIFRSEGVVDFIDVAIPTINMNIGNVNIYMNRWPTFNVADSSVVISVILFFITILFEKKKLKKG